ncbi:MAG TPA: glycosyltransferase family 2 protein [Myxococcota bacterium]|nr:glycosyltransferase family 2 protein [Myxococcota bacterium]
MKVSVSIVTYRSLSWIDRCLSGVFAQGDVVKQVLLVDNGSADRTVPHVRRRHPRVRVCGLDYNAGYAAAHNLNFASARGEFFLALNPDVVLAPDYLKNLLATMSRDAGLGAAVGRLLAPGPERLLDSAGIVPTAGRTRFVDRGRMRPAADFKTEEDVFGACGAAALYRSTALREVSATGEAPFAERFFMYYEDVDLAWRLRDAGWRTRYVPQAEAVHERGGSGAGSQFVEYHLVRNRLWLTLRNARGRELLREVPGLAVFQTAKLIQSVRRPHVRAALRDQLRGVRDSLRERAARSPRVGIAKLSGGRA